MSTPMSGAVAALREIVGAEHVITDPAAAVGYLTDWTGRYTGAALAVVRPADTAQVIDVVKVCAAHGIPICTQGGNTGLVGGSVPAPDGDGIVLSTARLTDIGQVDVIDSCIEVGAGVSVAEVARHAGQVGLAFGVDLASRDSATAGGIVATNAGGIHVICHGDTRAQVRGIEVVLADGSVVRRWKRVVKDNVGYDVPGLFAGSEGTLGVITRVLFGLVRPPARRFVLVAAIDAVGRALDLVAALGTSGLTIQAAELMTADGVDLVAARGHRRPTSASTPYYTLIEVSGTEDVETAVAEVLSRAEGVLDTAGQEAPAADLWAIREGHTEAIAASSTTVPVKLDVSVPLARMAEALAACEALGRKQSYACRTIIFGHIGDGNLHLNFLDVPLDRQDALTDAALTLVVDFDGSVSAEHGIGRAKTKWMSTRAAADVALMKSLRAAMDPAGMFNPGVLW